MSKEKSIIKSGESMKISEAMDEIEKMNLYDDLAERTDNHFMGQDKFDVPQGHTPDELVEAVSLKSNRELDRIEEKFLENLVKLDVPKNIIMKLFGLSEEKLGKEDRYIALSVTLFFCLTVSKKATMLMGIRAHIPEAIIIPEDYVRGMVLFDPVTRTWVFGMTDVEVDDIPLNEIIEDISTGITKVHRRLESKREMLHRLTLVHGKDEPSD